MIRILLALVVGLVAGLTIGAAVSRQEQPTYALSPDECKFAGMKPTWWEVHETFHGGIGHGGATTFTKFECRK